MKGRKIISLLLALTLIMTALPVQVFAKEKIGVGAPTLQELETRETTPGAIQLELSKYVGDGYEVEFKVKSQQSDTFSGEIILTNVGEYDLEEWKLQFKFQHDIIDLQNAILLNQQNNHYIIKGTDKNSTILKGKQIVIYFEATYDTEIVQPAHYILENKTSDGKIDLENYPQDEEAYRIWKEKVIEELKREQMNPDTNKISLFASGSTSGSVENEYIKFNYSNGTYGLFTTGGNPDNPNDDNKKLLYGTGSTSYTTIRIDGINHPFSPDIVTEFDNKIIGSKQYGDLIVSQHISIIPNQYTNRDDVVEFFYTVENTSDTPHDVGIRIMFDTMLGNNDHAPFRLPALGDVTTETDLFGDEIPEFWQAFDSLTNPNVIAQGTLKLDKSSSPDRVRFTNWGSATSNAWDYVRSAGSGNGDSAVCLYWNEKSVGKNDVFSCKTFYGLSALQQDLRPPLAVALSGATKLEVVEGSDGKEEYSPNPFTVTAYIQNIGTGAAENTNITLNLPAGMEVLDGNRTVSLGHIPVGTKQHQVSWKVKVTPGSIEKNEKYGVTVTAENADAKTLEREIIIPIIKRNLVEVQVNKALLLNNDVLNMKIINTSNGPLDTKELVAKYYYDYKVHGALSGVCNNVLLNGSYLGITNRKIKIANEETGFGNMASGILNIGLKDLGIVLESNDELQIEIDLKRSNNWAIEHRKNYSSDIINLEATAGNYKNWDTISVLDGKELIWGVVPEKIKGVIMTGIAAKDNSVEHQVDGLAPVLYLDLLEDNNELIFKGKIILNKEELEINSVGKGYQSDTPMDTNIGKNFYQFPKETDYEVLAFNIFENPNELNILRNLDLIEKNIIQVIIRDTNKNLIYIFEEKLEEKLSTQIKKINTIDCDQDLWWGNELWYDEFSSPKKELSAEMQQWYEDLLTVRLLEHNNPDILFRDEKLVSRNVFDNRIWVGLNKLNAAYVPKEIFEDTTNLSGYVEIQPWGGKYAIQQRPYNNKKVGIAFVKRNQPSYLEDKSRRYQLIDIFAWGSDPDSYQIGVEVYENQSYLYDTWNKKVDSTHPNYKFPFKAENLAVNFAINPESAAYFKRFTTHVRLTDNKNNNVANITTARILLAGYKDITSLTPKTKAVSVVTWLSLIANSLAFAEKMGEKNTDIDITDNSIILGSATIQIDKFKEIIQRFSVAPEKGFLKKAGDYFYVTPEIHHYVQDNTKFRPDSKDLAYGYSFVLNGINTPQKTITSCTVKGCSSCKSNETMILAHFNTADYMMKHVHNTTAEFKECIACRIIQK